MLKREQFLPAITTTSGSNWKEKIKEADKLNLKKVAIFPTCLEKKQRKEMYKLLKNSGIEEIPFIHLRTDMKPKEIKYLIRHFKTQAFNIHSQARHPLAHDYSKYKNMIYIENVYPLFSEKEIKEFAGICLDMSHLENDKMLNKETFENITQMLKKYPVGCNHVSAIREETFFDIESKKDIFACHYFESLNEFDYLKQYPENYFSNFIAIEVENTLKEQTEAIDYILNL